MLIMVVLVIIVIAIKIKIIKIMVVISTKPALTIEDLNAHVNCQFKIKGLI